MLSRTSVVTGFLVSQSMRTVSQFLTINLPILDRLRARQNQQSCQRHGCCRMSTMVTAAAGTTLAYHVYRSSYDFGIFAKPALSTAGNSFRS